MEIGFVQEYDSVRDSFVVGKALKHFLSECQSISKVLFAKVPVKRKFWKDAIAGLGEEFDE